MNLADAPRLNSVKPCTLADLPPPPPGKTGWPWTQESKPLAARRPDGSEWPRISIVTPSYNQGPYLEETLRSVLLQGYPNLEYHVLDGGSKDESVEILRKYEPWLSSWVSRRDKGQSDAINQGFRLCTGEIFTWVCSDDLLAEDALGAVATAFAGPSRPDVVVGSCYCQYDHEPQKNYTGRSSVDVIRRTPYTFAVWQPSCFFRNSLVARPELVRTDMHYCMDRELWCYLRSRGAVWTDVETTLSINRFTGENKSLTGRNKILVELSEIYRTYAGRGASLAYWLQKLWLPLVLTNLRHPSRLVRFGSKLSSRAVTLGLKLAFPDEAVRVLQKEFYRYSV